MVVVKNRSRGLRRYLEVTRQLWQLRRRRPDAYLVTFRGYEILPIVLALSGGRPVVFDEFVNAVEWFVYEHRKFREGSAPARVLRALFRRWSLRSVAVLTDTPSHAELSSRLMSIPRDHYRPVPVGTDEKTFAPRPRTRSSSDCLTVLYYGSMLPLHGLDHVLAAAVSLRDREDIDFELVGGDNETVQAVHRAVSAGARVRHRLWVDYERLPELFGECDLFLAGPFGDTVQSQRVITGKAYQFLCAGLPTVIGANHESRVVTDRVDALVVPQGSAEAIEEAILWAAEHREGLEAIGKAGRVLFEKRFSVDVIAAALDALPWSDEQGVDE
ncbi:glycosyltransferase [Gryllotalpicola koreensis]|uniref:glycosyltransferase n=1 Tax=Gryllotalpicola koreensis TaxID=993086 RepID=UPI0031D5CDD2